MDAVEQSAAQIQALVGRLDALTDRLDAQAAVIADQQATISRLTAVPAVVARKDVSPTTPVPVSPRLAASSRRGMLARVLGATAAAAVLTVAREAVPAEASTRLTIVAGGSTSNYGLIAAPGATDPGAGIVQNFNSQLFGVVGTLSPPSGIVPETGAGVLGTAEDAAGVMGLSSNGNGVHGISFGHTGVRGTCTAGAGGYGVWGFAVDSDGVFGSTDSIYGGSGVHGVTTKTSGYGVFGRGPGTAIYAVSDSPASPFVSGMRSECANVVGVYGSSTSADGVQGFTSGASAYGVFGRSPGVAVHGMSTSPASAPAAGVSGESANGAGVFGTSTKAFGVQGLSTNAYGVSGNSSTQAGVWGSSSSNVGVLGSSTSGVGVNGVSVSSNGVNGVSDTGIAVYGSSQNGTAGRFDGNVVIQGNLTVSGSFPHTAAVPSSDGTLRRLFSLEMAEAYYEDLGQGSLANGVGAVTLDPIFAALVRTDAYQVFLTAYGDNRGLYVANQTASGFDVREVQGGTSNIGFGYRVVAHPRDVPTSRLDRVTLPPAPAQPKLDRIEPLDVPATLRDLHHPDLPNAPQPAAPPPRVQDGR
jgi:hypothetical protein